MDSSDAGTPDTIQDDSNDSNMKLLLEIHSAKSETQSLKSEIEGVYESGGDTNMESLSEDCT